MRITQEADYALRIVCILAKDDKVLDAKTIADASGVTPRFALKILRKLAVDGLVRSYKGASGGYELAKDSKSLTALEIIEAIDGKVYINKCLSCDADCSRNQNKSDCKMHIAFGAINKRLIDNLSKINIGLLTNDEVYAADIVKVIK